MGWRIPSQDDSPDHYLPSDKERVGHYCCGPYNVGKGVDEDKVEEVVVEYARGYVASKFILQLQDMFASEVLYLIEDVPKLFIPPRDKNRDERIRSKAQNQRDAAEIEQKQKEQQQKPEENNEKENKEPMK